MTVLNITPHFIFYLYGWHILTPMARVARTTAFPTNERPGSSITDTSVAVNSSSIASMISLGVGMDCLLFVDSGCFVVCAA